MTRVLMLHAYDARNLGDGLLVEESVALIRNAVADVDLTILALRPESFEMSESTLISSKPTNITQFRSYVRTLRNIRDFDLVVAVGGGYLRFGGLTESLKSFVVHMPQLVAASRAGERAVYLPQSVGPGGRVITKLLAGRLSRMNTVYLRDDKSVESLNLRTAIRTPDLAIAAAAASNRGGPIDRTPVYSVRFIRGSLPQPVVDLASLLGSFDGYVQSTTGNNNDSRAMEQLRPQHTLSRSELFASDAKRVVVAVRLHAALMAIAAGHYVVHLGYERKGWGAFGDLGISEYVHAVRHFNPEEVASQVRSLIESEEVRDLYDQKVRGASNSAQESRDQLVDRLQDVAQTRRGIA